MKPEIILILAIYGSFIFLEILYTSFANKSGQRTKDIIVEIISTGVLLLLVQPVVLLCSFGLMKAFFPSGENALQALPFLAGFGLFLIFDDLTQYWWHRASHNIPWLYKLHRAHHDATYMSVRIVYRNNLFYYAMMPGIWLSGVLVYFGLGWVYPVYLVLKLSVIIGAHSDVRWDEPLYKIKALSPIMWVIERLISTPATHSAHHGRHASDDATNYKGNYGNFLFFWDVLFGTAKITRGYPKEFGVENLNDVNAAEQLIWPLVTTKT